MNKQYRWCERSGPVPYPSDASRMLDGYDELVSGEGWAELAELGFVEEVEPLEEPKKVAAKLKSVPAPESEPKSAKKPKKKPKKVAAKPEPVKSEPAAAPEPLPEAPPAPVIEKPAAGGLKKTVGEMVSEALSKSKDEPASVADQAQKVLSKRRTRGKAKARAKNR